MFEDDKGIFYVGIFISAMVILTAFIYGFENYELKQVFNNSTSYVETTLEKSLDKGYVAKEDIESLKETISKDFKDEKILIANTSKDSIKVEVNPYVAKEGQEMFIEVSYNGEKILETGTSRLKE